MNECCFSCIISVVNGFFSVVRVCRHIVCQLNVFGFFLFIPKAKICQNGITQSRCRGSSAERYSSSKSNYREFQVYCNNLVSSGNKIAHMRLRYLERCNRQSRHILYSIQKTHERRSMHYMKSSY